MNGYKIVLLKAILCFIGCRKVNGYAPEYVKFLSVYSPPDIVGGDDTAWCRMLVIVLPLTDDFVIDTFREWLYSLLFGFRFQPILIGLYVFFFAHFFAKLN